MWGLFYLFAHSLFGFFLVFFLFVLYVVFKCSDYRLGLPVCETLIRYFVP